MDSTHTRETSKSTPSTTLSNSDIKQNLYNFALKSDWEQVIEIYKNYDWTHTSTITKSGDTALHVAVIDDKYNFVKQLVDIITEINPANASRALGIQNERGNTPLHFAASRGYVEMCVCIAQVDPSLVGSRNNGGETPLFLAALRGHKDTFLFLHTTCPDKIIQHCRRNGGQIILHCTIQREYFDLAIHIIYFYEDLVNSVDENGITPLHVLASKPSAFRSGNHLQWWTNIIYHCYRNFPENYATCYELLKSACKEVPGPTGFGLAGIRKIKEKHTWSCQIMDKLLQRNAMYSSQKTGSKPLTQSEEEEETNPYNIRREVETTPSDIRNKINPVKQESPQAGEAAILEAARNGVVEMLVGIRDQFPVSIPGTTVEKKNTLLVAVENKQPLILEISIKKNVTNLAEEAKITPFLEAAKNGVVEMVDRILDLFPVSIHDTTVDKKNILLVAVENRQPRIFEILREKNVLKNLIQSVDSNENTVLHLAAMLSKYKPWQIPGSCLANAMGNQVV
ncbi:putative Ankyrin repeat-containing protein [Quillaja saponaria]|uniref:Ankyrin repeat-containing protein n=1 Tax=Quillaja saponaria TaxID=32244 RepID=A0AAD7Q0T6_QUISA|nr:putative Ankyrin repeat-containing protein [Quillaja saponaria]